MSQRVHCPIGHGTALHPRTQWVRVSGAIRATIEKPGFVVSHWVRCIYVSDILAHW